MDTGEDIKETLIPSEFEVWLNDRPKWLQTAAANLLEGVRYDAVKPVSDITNICMAEATADQATEFKSPPLGYFSKPTDYTSIAIESLSEVNGVNAIKDNASLTFLPKGLTVIYGANGSGKTGFSRLLKHACGSKSKEAKLLGNVFNDKDQSPSALITLSLNETNQKPINWTGDALSILKNVHIFDGKTASMYMVEKSEATYEPRKMRFVSALIKVCDQTREALNQYKNQLIKNFPAIPEEIEGSNPIKWLQTLNAETKQSEIDNQCSYPESLNEERIATEKNLTQKNIPARLLEIAKEKSTLAQLKDNLNLLKIGLSDEIISQYYTAQLDAQTKRQAATEYAQTFFASIPLEGVGQDTWLAMWNQARKFSLETAYPSASFPNTEEGAKCVLCQQSLDENAKFRLNNFEAFVQGGLESDAQTSEKIVNDLLSEFPKIPNAADWKLQINILKLEDAQSLEILSSLSQRHSSINNFSNAENLPKIDWSLLDEQLSQKTLAADEEEKTLNELLKDGTRLRLETRLTELKAMQWLNQNQQSVENEVKRLGEEKVYEKAISLTNTVALTKKNNELAALELEAGYQDRFKKELGELGGSRLPVTPISSPQGKGRVTFKVGLIGTKKTADATSILSEGENRIVALAAFLADISGSGLHTPFVFDDPISSLDQDFEEKVIARLVELAKERQVIIFTHRLSLLTLIEGAVKKIKSEAEQEQTGKTFLFKIESLRRLGSRTGFNVPQHIREQKVKSAVNQLRDTHIPQLKKFYDDQNIEAYEEKVKSLCSDFRVLLERAVEHVLFNEVILRFRRNVVTQNKLSALAKISLDDCNFIDDLMTRFSAFEHSQPEEFPIECPDIEALEADVTALATWVDEFSNRAIA
jgi:energy-coupling factor transporter ATP-binding protein EcfA2